MGKVQSHQNGAGKIGHGKRMEVDHYLILYTKIHSQWIKDLNIRRSENYLEENIGGKFLDIGFDDDFSYLTPKAKAKINKCDYIKQKVSG